MFKASNIFFHYFQNFLLHLLICLYQHSSFFIPSTNGADQGPLFYNYQYNDSVNNINNHGLSVSALFVFGDSTVDTGNNDYILTLAKSDFLPYGRDFANHAATGRFTNGKISSDFLAAYLGLKETLPPYLDPSISDHDLLTGVNFASAGTGFDPKTADILPSIPMLVQVEYMKEYMKKIELLLGKEGAVELVRESMFLVAAGSNDFIQNYYVLPSRSLEFSEEEYQYFMLDQLKQLLLGLYEVGGRKFVVTGLAPLGCLPSQMILSGDGQNCIGSLNSAATAYNLKLQAMLQNLGQGPTSTFQYAKFAYSDIYNAAFHLFMDPNKFGFEVSGRGCCGSGYLETGPLCNPYTPVCPDASKYVFWDAIHPTENVYRIFSELIYQTMLGILQKL